MKVLFTLALVVLLVACVASDKAPPKGQAQNQKADPNAAAQDKKKPETGGVKPAPQPSVPSKTNPALTPQIQPARSNSDDGKKSRPTMDTDEIKQIKNKYESQRKNQ